jgi:hypothetical protein
MQTKNCPIFPDENRLHGCQEKSLRENFCWAGKKKDWWAVQSAGAHSANCVNLIE